MKSLPFFTMTLQSISSQIVIVLLTDLLMMLMLPVTQSTISHFLFVTEEVCRERVVYVGMGVEQVSEIIFSTLVLILSAGVTAHIFHGYGSKKWKESFLAIILAIACLTQVPPPSADHERTRNDQSDRFTSLLMLLLRLL